MKLRTMVRTFAAIARRDWLDSSRHRTWFAVQVGTTAAQLGGFYLFARAIGPRYRPDGMDYYPYLLIGTAMFGFYVSGVSSFVSSLREAQTAGTLEAMMNTRTPPPLLVGLGAVSVFCGAALRMVALIVAGAAPISAGMHLNWAAALGVILLSVLVAVSMGMLAAAAQVMLQRGELVVWLFGIGGWLLTGMAFPVSKLPAALRQLATLVPVTYSIQALRAALLQDGTWGPVARPMALLAVGAAVLLPLSATLLAAVIHRARLKGTLSFY